MDRRIVALLMVVLLDGMGLGLTLPILPSLLRSLGHDADIGWSFGAFIGLYALMQFLLAPVLGAWSDRIGRRPVLMLSLAGAAVDYLFMAFAPNLALLFIGRAIAGATSATMAVASASIADLSPEDRRARHFGLLSAAVGLGFIAGPALGGVLGEHWLRAPFLAAAALNAVNLAFICLCLPEPGREAKQSVGLSLNPLKPLRWAFSVADMAPLIGAFLVFAFIGQIGGTVWTLYGQDRFGWSTSIVGLSLAGFGLLHALAQALVVGPLCERWGERRTMLVGMAADAAAYLGIAFVTQGWLAFMLLPLFCLGGIGTPALQSLLSSQVSGEQQGRLQGVLASLTSLVSVVGPLLVSLCYFATQSTWPGLVWAMGAGLYLLCLPVVFGDVRHRTVEIGSAGR